MTPPDPDQLLADAAAAGIHRLPIPTPFLVGRVNCYLILDDPLTLVDTGPNSGTSLDELEQALAGFDVRVEDLERVVLTHQHMDHVGLLHILSRRSGAEVVALAPLRPWLADYSAQAAGDDQFAQAVMRRHGVPEDLSIVLGAMSAAFRAYGSRAEVTRTVVEGDVLEFRDRRLEVLHRPGHSPSDTVFWDADRAILLAGDHLIGHISSNPLIARPLGGGLPGLRPRPLIDYLASLLKTREMPVQMTLPGHGDPVAGHAELIDERMRLTQRRAAKILRLLTEAPGPLTAHQLAEQMWGNVAVSQAFLTLSEVLGHLDVLATQDAVIEEFDGEYSVFRPA
ncbi:MAG TPA: MBL fold metallo-hydrolase [Solirubrobacteraceae bacterium]|nr:MBL fold metallo-hydrolase [Solirubrobacteraceae bacterium]